MKVPLDHERALRAVTARLASAATVTEACQATIAALRQHASGRSDDRSGSNWSLTALLWAHDRLRCVAASGSWQIFSTVRPGTGVVSRAFTSGKTEVVAAVSADPDYLPLRPDVTAEICAPILDPTGQPIGVLDLDWVGEVDLDAWREIAEQAASALGARISQLGGPPAESRSEKLLRHATALTAAPSANDLLIAAITAARDVSGLPAALLLLDGAQGPVISASTEAPTPLESRMRASLAAAGPAVMKRLISLAHRYGTSYTSGETGHPATPDHNVLVTAGAGTLIGVPLGLPESGGILLAADQRVRQPDPTAVSLLELLAAQAWLCLDRLRTLAWLREQAGSDPLTGLPHHGSFGKRMAVSTPGRTALLAIDIDDFKNINDTYGHQVGDQVLVDLARALKAALRQGDELYRIGGDEFVAVVEVSRSEEAVGIAERLADAARRTDRTISVGVALQHDGELPELTLRRADIALYEVKRKGRNGVRLAAY